MKRRTWILSALGASGALVVGWSVLPARSRLGDGTLMLSTEGDIALNGWIKISPLGDAVLAMPRSEMGQGVHTALAMLAAEELDLPLTRVRLEQAGADAIYGNVAAFVSTAWFHPRETESGAPAASVRVGHWMLGKVAREMGINMTGGSTTVADLWEPVRMAAATARAALLGAAAARWKVAVDDIQVANGAMQAGGQQAHYGELVADAAGRKVGTVKPKDAKDWKLIGKPTPRTDIAAKTHGTAQFGIDVRLPGMLFASLRQCPMLGGSVASLDGKDALALPGVRKLVPLAAAAGSTAGYAIVADTTWHARQALDAVKVDWQAPAGDVLDTEKINAALHSALDSDGGFVFHARGDIDAAEAGATRKFTALYQAPYLAHATLEPMNCTAQLKDGVVDLWVPTQVPQMAVEAAARTAGVNKAQVRLHVTLLGGGFGRRLEVDTVVQAVHVAMQCDGRPVQLTWSREEDTTHDFYRPMHVAKLQAAVDAAGQIASLRIQSAGDAIGPRYFERNVPAMAGPFDTPDKTGSEGLFDLPYGIAHQKMSHVATRSGVPVGFWRSVGHSHNAFFSEGFIDELAGETQQDPLQLRLQLLQHAPRHAAVLQLAANQFGWGKAVPQGRARGIALHESFGSIVAQAVEVSLQDGLPRVHRVVCAIDCGTVVNPDTVAQQMESCVVFALTAALYGRIDIREGRVQQSNFYDYPMLKLAQAPRVETHIVPSTRAPSGVGEPGVPPLAPAVAGALFALTGKRQRALPFVAVS